MRLVNISFTYKDENKNYVTQKKIHISYLYNMINEREPIIEFRDGEQAFSFKLWNEINYHV